jgi:hypothetical protein
MGQYKGKGGTKHPTGIWDEAEVKVSISENKSALKEANIIGGGDGLIY